MRLFVHPKILEIREITFFSSESYYKEVEVTNELGVGGRGGGGGGRCQCDTECLDSFWGGRAISTQVNQT